MTATNIFVGKFIYDYEHVHKADMHATYKFKCD